MEFDSYPKHAQYLVLGTLLVVAAVTSKTEDKELYTTFYLAFIKAHFELSAHFAIWLQQAINEADEETTQALLYFVELHNKLSLTDSFTPVYIPNGAGNMVFPKNIKYN